MLTASEAQAFWTLAEGLSPYLREVLARLVAGSPQGQTTRDIAFALGRSTQQINVALRTLRRQGWVESTPGAEPQGQRTGPTPARWSAVLHRHLDLPRGSLLTGTVPICWWEANLLHGWVVHPWHLSVIRAAYPDLLDLFDLAKRAPFMEGESPAYGIRDEHSGGDRTFCEFLLEQGEPWSSAARSPR